MRTKMARETITFSQKQVELFAQITGDINPIHLDENYASRTIFKRPIVHGILSVGIISKLIGTKYPGEGTIYLGQEIKFLKPVYVDKQYDFEVSLLEVLNKKHRALLSTKIFDGTDLVLDGQALVMNPKVFPAG